jgi:hypothetical protein
MSAFTLSDVWVNDVWVNVILKCMFRVEEYMTCCIMVNKQSYNSRIFDIWNLIILYTTFGSDFGGQQLIVAYVRFEFVGEVFATNGAPTSF